MTISVQNEFIIKLRMKRIAANPNGTCSVRFLKNEKSISLSKDITKVNSWCKENLGTESLTIDSNWSPDKVTNVLEKIDLNAPQIIVWEGNGIFVVAQSAQSVASILNSLQSGNAISKEKLQPVSGKIAGVIAIITGSAQGFGSGIAEELVKEGASVVISDLNEQLGLEFSNELNRKYGDGVSIFYKTDVTNLENLDKMCQATIEAFGGCDMLVSNAGVLKAGSLQEMDEKTFEFITNVNYKAYFLCSKAVSSVMKFQHSVNPEFFMDIVQINSKSGLEGSNKNFAYAGSKFGGIGLTQSFAMELVEFNVKVNSICPGNFFEGPLWSDPEKGLFVQYLRTGKVPGAKTIADVKKFYTDKVPMKRGCTPEDVAKAIFYLHDQKYETGQALPVTGGQVMLK